MIVFASKMGGYAVRITSGLLFLKKRQHYVLFLHTTALFCFANIQRWKCGVNLNIGRNLYYVTKYFNNSFFLSLPLRFPLSFKLIQSGGKALKFSIMRPNFRKVKSSRESMIMNYDVISLPYYSYSHGVICGVIG